MTNKEAIKYLTELHDKAFEHIPYNENYHNAVDLAIKALEEYPTDKEIQNAMQRTYLGGKEE